MTHFELASFLGGFYYLENFASAISRIFSFPVLLLFEAFFDLPRIDKFFVRVVEVREIRLVHCPNFSFPVLVLTRLFFAPLPIDEFLSASS